MTLLDVLEVFTGDYPDACIQVFDHHCKYNCLLFLDDQESIYEYGPEDYEPYIHMEVRYIEPVSKDRIKVVI